MDKTNPLSTFLFAHPSFFEGLGRVVDFGGFLNEYNYSPSPEQADQFAMWADWTAVGNELRGATLDELLQMKQELRKMRNVEKFEEATPSS